VLQRALASAPADVLEPDAFPDWMSVRANDAPFAGATLTAHELERAHIARVVAWASSFDEAARVLGMDPATVRRKLRAPERSPHQVDPWLSGHGDHGSP
jgi:NtrC-family two-component system response regulator AlgB